MPAPAVLSCPFLCRTETSPVFPRPGGRVVARILSRMAGGRPDNPAEVRATEGVAPVPPILFGGARQQPLDGRTMPLSTACRVDATSVERISDTLISFDAAVPDLLNER
jgi:hypothetical protein